MRQRHTAQPARGHRRGAAGCSSVQRHAWRRTSPTAAPVRPAPEIEEAARLAEADGFVRALKNGYDTYVGERGRQLSGGQKQRLAIARVFLKNPRILLLDEATSALDNESEILVGQSLDKLAKGRTTLTIAHRLTTIQNADRILVLGPGRHRGGGQPWELLARQGRIIGCGTGW